MSRRFCLVAVTILTVALVATFADVVKSAAAKRGDSISFFVSPDGNDGWPGTKARPFASLQRAQAAIRELPRPLNSDVLVNLRDGTHFLDHPLELSGPDSGGNGHDVTYLAYRYGSPSSEHPVVSGGERISGWQMHDRENNVWVAPVGTLETRQLFVNGLRATRASLGAGLPGAFEITETGYETDSTAPQAWDHPSDIELVYRGAFGQRQWPWTEARCGIADISGDADSSMIVMDQPCFDGANRLYAFSFGTGPPGIADPMDVENSGTFLSEPGTFYLDRSDPDHHMLFYIPRPGEHLTGRAHRRAAVVAPKLETLVSGVGTQAEPLRNVTFQGLTFAHATWLAPSSGSGFVHVLASARYTGDDPNDPLTTPDFETTPAAVTFRSVEDITLRHNHFEHLGGMGLEFVDSSSRNLIAGNRFTDLSDGALAMGVLPPDIEGSNIDNRVVDNRVSNIGVEYRGAAGIWVAYTQGTTIAHNEVSDVPHNGIFSGAIDDIFNIARDERIVKNRLFNTMQVLDDGGGIYLIGEHGQSAASGVRVVGNAISDGPEHGTNNIGLYTDDTLNWATLSGNAVFGYQKVAGGCVWPFSGVFNLRFIDNFWDQPEPTWLCGGEPTNTTITGTTVLDPSNPKGDCESIPRCRAILREAGPR